MSNTDRFSDEQLMAYADGELDAATRAQIEAALATDAELAGRIAQHHALRARMQAAFAPVLNEPVPERLLEAARAAPPGASAATVTDLAAARLSKTEKRQRRWSWPEWGAMAASLTLGLAVGYLMLGTRSAGPILAENGRLIADGVLEAALSQQLAQEQRPADAVQMGPSFVAESGAYCRTFMLRDGDDVAGLACREEAQWQLHMLVREAPVPGGEGYRMAGSAMPRVLMEAVENRMAGEPLDAEGETEARRRGWQ